jgi:archaellum component FlaG (FlaF/FlaG flagellin family)
MHDSWHRFFSQMTSSLQDNVSEEGFVVAAQPKENIDVLNTPKSMGRVIFNSSTNKMSVNNSGTYKEIYTRPEELTTAQIGSISPTDINGTWVTNKDNGKLLYGINGSFKEIAYT